MADTEEWQGPQWGNVVYLLQPSCLALVGTACSTVLIACLRAVVHDLDIHLSGASHDEGTVTLDHRQAVALPLISSCALLVLFFFFRAIQFLLLLLLCVAAVVAIAFCLQPLADAAVVHHPALRRRVALCSWPPVPAAQLLQSGLGVAAVGLWLITGSMALNNLIGVSLCIAFISFVRLPNVKVCTILLSALFCYDIFWVFFSARLFGDNVMVAAATKQADNPAFLAAQALHLPSGLVARSLELPVKLLFPARLLSPSPQEPSLMLGLGDMALPGMLLALLLCHDVHSWGALHAGGGTTPSGAAPSLVQPLRALLRWSFWRQSYTLPSWVGYAAGLFAALGVGTVFQAAQPALLYLVPGTLLPVLAKAAARGEVRHLWEGLPVPAGYADKRLAV